MATILTVHGTFASGPEEGSAWWQRGGECCGALSTLVEGEDGPVKVEPVVWDGLNSEQSRQAAGIKLLERMVALDKAGERYCVVGHSHGGSVAAAALIRAAFTKQPLERLSRWITIGTPFITARRDKFIFSRMGQTGKVIFLTVMAVFITVPFMLPRLPAATGVDRTTGYYVALWAGALLTPVLIAYPFMWWSERNAMPWHKPRTQSKASQSFAAKWLSLRHDDDEAVQSLASLEAMKQPIFQRNFAVEGLSKWLAIIFVPLLVFLGMTKLVSRTDVNGSTAAKQETTAAPASTTVPAPAASAPAPAPQAAAAPAQSGATATPDSGNDVILPSWARWAIAIGSIAIFLVIPYLIYRLVRLLAYPTSALLSRGLNTMAWSQLQRASLGNDLEGETARFARDRPMWVADGHPVLPAEMRKEITAVSDAAAAKAVAKIRAALSELGVMQIEKDGKDALNDFLTGEELIHTTYFKVPRFRKLVACAISQSPGFRPTAAFRADPDFALVKGWYEALIAPAGKPAAQPVAAKA